MNNSWSVLPVLPVLPVRSWYSKGVSSQSSDPFSHFPQNPSFVAAMNRSKAAPKPVLAAVVRSNPAAYSMQRNMFERVKTTGNGCASCRGNK